MNDFKWRHFTGEIILHCVRWYCNYGISYRDLQDMMEERGISVELHQDQRGMEISVSRRQRARQDHRILSVQHPQYHRRHDLSEEGAAGGARLEPAAHHHNGQEPHLRGCHCPHQRRKKGGRAVTAPHDQIPQQHCRGRSRQAQASYQTHARLQVDEDRLRHDQGL